MKTFLITTSIAMYLLACSGETDRQRQVRESKEKTERENKKLDHQLEVKLDSLNELIYERKK